MILYPRPRQVRKAGARSPLAGTRCGLPLMQAVDVQFQPASQIPDLLAYGGGGGLAEWDVLVDRVDPEQAGLPGRRRIELARQRAAVQDRQCEVTAGAWRPACTSPADSRTRRSAARGPSVVLVNAAPAAPRPGAPRRALPRRPARRIRAVALNGTARLRRPVNPSLPCRAQSAWPPAPGVSP